MLQNLSDGELIKLYLHEHSERAFKVLVERHYTRTRQRFLRHCHHAGDADDLYPRCLANSGWFFF